DEPFKMTIMAIRLSSCTNGVSKLHGRVSRKMWSALWPNLPVTEVPIASITNGVHIKSWISDEMNFLYDRYLGPIWADETVDNSIWNNIEQIPDEELWRIHQRCKEHLVAFARNRLKTQIQRRGTYHTELNRAEEILDPEVLTIGFARRFTAYKRGNLLLKNPKRLVNLLNNTDRPVQVIFAGKAHPRDTPGQDLIKMIVEISKRPEFIGKIVFLQNYDIMLAKRLVKGVDIWLNTPTRPLEASGTSGEKAVMNGTMHFSVLDGWWAEGYREDSGWALPIERSFDNQELQDELDAERIYTLLENDITEKFYNRNQEDIPEDWVGMIRTNIAHVAPEFTMNRMLRDYIDRFYVKLFERTLSLKKGDYIVPKELSHWKHRILENWKNIRVVEYDIPDVTREEFIVGETYTGKVVLDLGGLKADEIGVEMVHAKSASGHDDTVFRGTQEFECTRVEGTIAEYTFVQEVEETGVFDIGFRIYPKNEMIPHRMDFPLVRWI
ncbi:MAG: alpha-glucan family phosphorylase, partial [Bacteroidales bacterium]|nr:alpha-glucan family phosphorylase [Bacteroidales bacterium]